MKLGSSIDLAHGRDISHLTHFTPRVVDKGLWRPRWGITKFKEHKDRVYKAGREGVSLDEITRQFQDLLMDRMIIPDNVLLNEGINELWTLVAGTGATKFDNTNANIGVGDSSAAEAASQTALQAASNKLYKAMDGGWN